MQETEPATEMGVLASYMVALKIAKTGRPFTEGDFVKDCMVECSEVVCPSAAKSFASIPLSNDTIQRRVIDIAADMKDQLKDVISQCVYFSIALDESTDITDTAQLAVFARLVDKNFNVTEELLEVIPLKGTTTGEDIFNAVDELLDNINLDLKKMSSAATDGAPAMLGDQQGFAGRLQKKLREAGLPPILIVHCILHQQQLCAKVFHKFKSVIDVVKRCVNICRKQGLNHRDFREFLNDFDAEFGDVPFYCEVRWLSIAKTLRVFFALIALISTFLDMKGKPEPLLEDKQWIADLAFLADFTQILHDLNVSLQGKDKLIGHLWDRIRSFQVELDLYREQLTERNFENLPCLQQVDVSGLNFDEHVNALVSLQEEFNDRFTQIRGIEKELHVFMTPFSVPIDQAPSHLKLELIRLQHDSVLKDRYYHFQCQEGILSFYKAFKQEEYPRLHDNALKLVSMFGTTFLCEFMFSLMKLSKNKHRASMSDATLQSVMRIQSSSSIRPNLHKMVQKRQCHPSH